MVNSGNVVSLRPGYYDVRLDPAAEAYQQACRTADAAGSAATRAWYAEQAAATLARTDAVIAGARADWAAEAATAQPITWPVAPTYAR